MTIAITPNFGTTINQTERLAYLSGFYGVAPEFLGFCVQTSGAYDIQGQALNAASAYEEHTEGTSITTKSPEQGFAATPRKERYSIGYAFSGEEWTKMQPGAKARFLLSLSGSSQRRYIESAYGIVNRFTSYASNPDGKAILANDHPSNVGTQSNLSSSALDFAEAKAGRMAIMRQKGPDGQKLGLRPTVGLAALDLEGTIYKLANATHQADDLSDPNFTRAFGVEWNVSDYVDSATRHVMFSPEGIRNLQLHTTMAPGLIQEKIPMTKQDVAILDETSMQTIAWGWDGIYGR